MALRPRNLVVLAGCLLAVVVLVASTQVSPSAPVLLVLAGAAALVVVSDTWHGLLVVVGATTLLPIPFSIQVGPVTASVGRVLLWALVVGWIATRTRPDRPIRPRATSLDLPLLLLLGVMALSMVANLAVLSSDQVLGAARKLAVFGIDYLALFWITVSVLHERGRVERLLRFLGGLVAVVAVLGLLEHVTRQNVFELLSPILPASVDELLRTISATSGEALSRGSINRVRSTTEGPLAFGLVLLVGFPLTATFALLASDLRSRIWWGLGTAAVSAALLLTAARSVYLLLGATLLALLFALPERKARMSLLGAGALISGLFLVQTNVRNTMFDFFRPQRGVVLEGSLQARVDDYEPVLELVSQRPILGFGPRTFAADALARNGLVDDPANLVLDNAYLGQLAETGVLGLLALLGFLATALVSARRARRAATTREERYLGAALVTITQSWILMGFVADEYQFNAPPRIFFVVLGVIAINRVRSGWPDDLETRDGGRRRSATASASAPAG